MSESALPLVTALHHDGRILLARFNRPRAANGIDGPTADALLALADRVERDTRIEALVLTGTGKTFCSGGDVAMFAATLQAGAQPLPALLDSMATRVHGALARLVNAGALIVGAINGPATGAGLGVVAACDFAYARPTATLRSGFARLGLSPDTGTTWFLPRRMGTRAALKFLLSTEPLSAATGRDLGLFDELIEAADESAFVEEVLARTAKLLLPTGATRATRRLVLGSATRSLHDQLREEQASLVALASTPAVDAHIRAALGRG